MTNQSIVKILHEISLFLEMDGVPFKPRAYENAAQTISRLDTELKELYTQHGRDTLNALPGVGAQIATKIKTLLTTGTLPYYNRLKKKYPLDIIALTAIEGVGPKTAKTLYNKLNITDVQKLVRATKQGKIRALPNFGKKKEEKILASVAFFEKSHERFVIHNIYPYVQSLTQELRSHDAFTRVDIAGSLRRMKETVGDVDLLATARDARAAMTAFTSHKRVQEVLTHGTTKANIRLVNGIEVDLRIVSQESYGAALMYFSGSKEHNIILRNRARDMGYMLNEYGLYPLDRGRKKTTKKQVSVAGKTEEEVYRRLGLAYIPPELREDEYAVPRAEKKRIPKLIDYTDLKGDLQIQTSWTDGQHSIEQMAIAARETGLEYILITDHTKTLTFIPGLNETGLRKQWKEIDRLNKKFKGAPYILKGAEVNILEDGSLDINDETLAKLDMVGAAVHQHRKMSKAQMTKRICTAMQHAEVDILFHPTGRIVGRRDEYPVDIDEIISCAKQTGTILEANASQRLDLKDVYIKKAIQAGVKLSISSDAHDISHFANLRFGIGQARRGWAQKKDVINAYPRDKMLRMLKRAKK